MRAKLPPLTLRPRYLSAQQARVLPWLVALVFLAPLAVPVLAIYFILPAPHPEGAGALVSAWLELAARMWGKSPGQTLQAAVLFSIPAIQLWYFRLAERAERLALDANGISYHSPLPEFLRPLKRSWSIRWEALRSASLTISPPGRFGTVLVLDSGARRVRLTPCRWVDASTPEPSDACPKPGFLSTAATSRADVEQSPLLRYLAAAGIAVDGSAAAPGFALEHNKRTKAAMVLLFIALAYALGDTFFVLQEAYAGSSYLAVYTATGVLAALASAAWMHRGMVPLAESVGVGLMLGAACGAALYPGLLRLNQLTDTAGLHSVEYHCTAPGIFVPMREGPPALEFHDNAEYWAQFPAGASYRFDLRRGGLGFYQFSLAPIHEDMRRYFDGKRSSAANGNREKHKP